MRRKKTADILSDIRSFLVLSISADANQPDLVVRRILVDEERPAFECPVDHPHAHAEGTRERGIGSNHLLLLVREGIRPKEESGRILCGVGFRRTWRPLRLRDVDSQIVWKPLAGDIVAVITQIGVAGRRSCDDIRHLSHIRQLAHEFHAADVLLAAKGSGRDFG